MVRKIIVPDLSAIEPGLPDRTNEGGRWLPCRGCALRSLCEFVAASIRGRCGRKERAEIGLAVGMMSLYHMWL